jgi:uncharacterized protein (TIGR03000 family)
MCHKYQAAVGCLALILGLSLAAPTAQAQVFYDTSVSTLPPHVPFGGIQSSTIVMTSINYPTVYGAYSAWYTPTTFTYGATPSPFSITPYYMDMDARLLRWQEPVMAGFRTTRYTVKPVEVSAYVDVRVPEDAVVYIQGKRMELTGTERRFVSPALNPDTDYTYTIRATWTEDDREVSKTKRLAVRAGEHREVRFGPAAEYRSTLKSQPAP